MAIFPRTSRTRRPASMQNAASWGDWGGNNSGGWWNTNPRGGEGGGGGGTPATGGGGGQVSAASQPSTWDTLLKDPENKVWDLKDREFSEAVGAWYGFPLMDAQLKQLGFQMVNGQWVRTNEQDYDVKGVSRQFANVRDTMEPELQRQMAQMGQGMEGRGLGRSSVALGGESGLRGGYLKNLMQQRFGLVEQSRQEQWQRMLQTIAAAQQQAGVAASSARPVQQDGGGMDWGSLLGGVPWGKIFK